MRTGWLLLLAVGSCTGGSPGADAAPPADSADADIAEVVATDTVLPPMPDVPKRRAGHLVAVAVGGLDSTWSWPFHAGRCARPAMLFMLPRELGHGGASILLELPPGEMVGDYPVRFADSAGVPQPPAAMVGLQFMDDQRADAYQAAEGTVTVSRLDETRVSGTFRVTVRHVVTDRRARIAGVFQDVEIEALPPDYCERLQAAQDSIAPGS
jgi:hypothetical protein